MILPLIDQRCHRVLDPSLPCSLGFEIPPKNKLKLTFLSLRIFYKEHKNHFHKIIKLFYLLQNLKSYFIH